MEKYVPDIYQKSIYSINYDSLLSRGIKCLLFDLDNTLAPLKEKTPNEKLKKLFQELKEKGFKIIIFTNSPKVRAKPFMEGLQVDCCAYAKKPSTAKLLSVIEMYKYNFSEVAIIGDSMIDDIACGNIAEITTVLINRIAKREYPLAWIKRRYEKHVLKKLRDKDLFTKGRYYE